ncbi:hypothetical protein DSO57_1010783 [Entomophthora muscae]|uniref:Uncharacterized protein n=1 Tax=Entomophthora muscae TaxID=34485 RepID=A0ACC2US61_9FUNG|nr:hypothetical protein DSO57_1010783 [Entomophthora muscae]
MQYPNIASLVAISILATGSYAIPPKPSSGKYPGSVPEIKIVFDTANDAPTPFEPVIGSGIPYDETYFGRTPPKFFIGNTNVAYPPDEEATSANVPYGNHLKPSNIVP